MLHLDTHNFFHEPAQLQSSPNSCTGLTVLLGFAVPSPCVLLLLLLVACARVLHGCPSRRMGAWSSAAPCKHVGFWPCPSRPADENGANHLAALHELDALLTMPLPDVDGIIPHPIPDDAHCHRASAD